VSVTGLDRQFVIRAALLVREEVAALRLPVIYQGGPPNYTTFGGLCAVVSFALGQVLYAKGYTEVDLATGMFCRSTPTGHCWLELPGSPRTVIDATAKQFYTRFASVRIAARERAKDYRALAKGKDALASLHSWGSQNPYRYVDDLNRVVESVTLRLAPSQKQRHVALPNLSNEEILTALCLTGGTHTQPIGVEDPKLATDVPLVGERDHGHSAPLP